MWDTDLFFTVYFYTIYLFKNHVHLLLFKQTCSKKRKKWKQTVLYLTSLIGVIDIGIALFVACRWLEQMNLGWCQMHPLKMIWLTIFLTWLMRQASLIDHDLGVKCSVAIVGYKHFGHGGRMQGCCGIGTEKSVFPTLIFLLFWQFVPFLLINFSCLPFMVD